MSDASRKIAKIEYDYNNNPVRIQFTNGNVTKYIYSASGEKMRVIYQTAVANINVAIGETRELTTNELVNKKEETVDYLLGGALTLKNGRIDKYQFEEGYCQAEKYSATQDDFTFCYYDQDHLGNIRQVMEADGTKKGTIIQRVNYYPFGAEFCDNGVKSYVQSRKYNGKEFDHMHGLNTYDYGARQYNPVTARWDRIDPLCEKYYSTSPYAYCLNNPVRFIDPDGRKIQLCGKRGAELLQYINSLSKTQYTIDNQGYLMATSETVDGNSSKYSEWLNLAIKEEDKTIQAHIGQYVKNEKGVLESIDNYGGGATTTEYDDQKNITGIDVVIGDDNGSPYCVKIGGKQVGTTMALTLMHEFVGHAIPKLLLWKKPQRLEGNAIKNENAVRKELCDKNGKPLALRDEDRNHGEYKDH